MMSTPSCGRSAQSCSFFRMVIVAIAVSFFFSSVRSSRAYAFSPRSSGAR